MASVTVPVIRNRFNDARRKYDVNGGVSFNKKQGDLTASDSLPSNGTSSLPLSFGGSLYAFLPSTPVVLPSVV